MSHLVEAQRALKQARMNACAAVMRLRRGLADRRRNSSEDLFAVAAEVVAVLDLADGHLALALRARSDEHCLAHAELALGYTHQALGSTAKLAPDA